MEHHHLQSIFTHIVICGSPKGPVQSTEPMLVPHLTDEETDPQAHWAAHPGWRRAQLRPGLSAVQGTLGKATAVAALLEGNEHTAGAYYVPGMLRATKSENSDILFFWSPKPLWMVAAATKLKEPRSLEGKL